MHRRRGLKGGSNDLYFARERQLQRFAQHLAEIILGECPKALVAMIFADAFASPFLLSYAWCHTASQYLRAPETSHGTCKDKDKPGKGELST